ncbi:hypothetical protein MBUL_04452 (plasmid) [Methylobacterium bullatum]|uniref:Uncharacterized protein n=1 Tax=Methylobacterium bullatum TaxID=570505 RepID=A0A679JDL7_9HYPH|nr:hypothetical protein MBUL_04452 [Methylobacterium bullatum]
MNPDDIVPAILRGDDAAVRKAFDTLVDLQRADQVTETTPQALSEALHATCIALTGDQHPMSQSLCGVISEANNSARHLWPGSSGYRDGAAYVESRREHWRRKFEVVLQAT